MLFLASAISYIDRQTVSIVAPLLSREFHLDNEQVGRILSAFLLTYTFGQLLAGRFLDWAGTRSGLAISIGLWSLANVLTGAVSRFVGFVFFRSFLGLGEAGNWPGGVKAVTEWFPPEERAFAGGLFTSGASVGAIIAGPLVGAIAQHWGWRAAFAVTGSLGLVWIIGWLFVGGAPAAPPVEPSAAAKSGLRWIELLRFRQVWALVIARLLEEPVLWVGIFWLPKYIVDVRGLSILETGWLLTLPYMALGSGYVSGGWISGRLALRRWPLQRSKLAVMICAVALMTCSIPAAFAGSVAAFSALISLSMLGHGAWFSNVLTMPSDIAPPELVASVYGIAAMGGGLGGMIFTEATGVIIDRFHSYTPVFMTAGLLPLLATAVLMLLGGKMRVLVAQCQVAEVR
jgi:ACS family hexuronate transporter-like MFS transporter